MMNSSARYHAWHTAIWAMSLAFVLATGSAAIAATMAPPSDPSQGDGGVSSFYIWEKVIPDTPGKLLRTEPLPETSGLPDAEKQMRILYTSTDGVDGHTPVVVSGSLFVPRGTPPKNGWPLLAWAHGTTGLADVCAPSWMSRSADDSRDFRDSHFLNAWLHAGFAIVATDYQGLGVPGPHPYVNMRANAYSLLDSIRAVPRHKFHITAPVLIAGWSQGAGTATAAAGYAPQYASDLDIRGTIVTGVPNLSEEAMKSGLTSSKSGVTALVYIAMQARQLHPDLKPEDIFTDAGMPIFKAATHMCLPELRQFVAQAHTTPDVAMRPGMAQRLYETDTTYKIYPTLKLASPLFVGIGGADVNVVTDTQLILVKQLCKAGTTVEAHFYPGLGHAEGMDASASDAIAFAHHTLAGQAITPVCDPKTE